MDKPNYSPSITFNAIKYYIMWCPPISCFIAPLTSSIYRYIYRKYPQVLAIGVINYLSYQTRAPPCMFHSISSKIYIFPLYVHYMSIIYVHCICPLYMSIIYVHYICPLYVHNYVAMKPLQSPFSQHHCHHWDEPTGTNNNIHPHCVTQASTMIASRPSLSCYSTRRAEGEG